MLPLVVHEAGGGAAWVSGTVTSSMLAGLLAQVPGGWIADRFGRRPVLVSGLVLHLLVALLFLTGWGGLPAILVWRALEGVAAALATTAALALAADGSPPASRGRRVARLSAAQSAGLAIGPALGMPFLTLGVQGVFLATAVLAALSLLLAPGLAVPRAVGSHLAGEADPDEPEYGRPAGYSAIDLGLLTQLACRAVGGGMVVGMYESTWADFMIARQAGPLMISASWGIFAVPPILLASLAGSVLDRRGPARPLVLGSIVQAAAVCTYPLWPGPAGILVGCMAEGTGFAFSMPAHQVLAIRTAAARWRGRVLGGLGAAFTLGVIIGAWGFPQLEGRAPGVMFPVAGAAILLTSLPFARRDTKLHHAVVS